MTLAADELQELKRRLEAVESETLSLRARVTAAEARLSTSESTRERSSTILLAVQAKMEAGHKLLSAQIAELNTLMHALIEKD